MFHPSLYASWSETEHYHVCFFYSCDVLFVCLKAVCSGVLFITAAAAQASGLDHVTVMSASGEGLQSAAGEDLEPEEDQDPSGMFNDPTLLRGSHTSAFSHFQINIIWFDY